MGKTWGTGCCWIRLLIREWSRCLTPNRYSMSCMTTGWVLTLETSPSSTIPTPTGCWWHIQIHKMRILNVKNGISLTLSWGSITGIVFSLRSGRWAWMCSSSLNYLLSWQLLSWTRYTRKECSGHIINMMQQLWMWIMSNKTQHWQQVSEHHNSNRCLNNKM